MNGLIVLSGIDSSGKSTQIKLLQQYFEKRKKRCVILWTRGGYTYFMELMKKTLRLLLNKKMPPSGNNALRDKQFEKKSVQLLWLNMALTELIFIYGILIRVLLFKGYIIICDRYLWDTYIDFKMNLKKIKFEKMILWRLLEKISKRTQCSIIIIIDVDESIKRSIQKNEPFSENKDKRLKRYCIYDKLINEGKWKHNIDGKMKIHEIKREIMKRCFYEN